MAANDIAKEEQDTKYGGITCELEEEGMQTNMFSVLCVTVM